MAVPRVSQPTGATRIDMKKMARQINRALAELDGSFIGVPLPTTDGIEGLKYLVDQINAAFDLNSVIADAIANCMADVVVVDTVDLWAMGGPPVRRGAPGRSQQPQPDLAVAVSVWAAGGPPPAGPAEGASADQLPGRLPSAEIPEQTASLEAEGGDDEPVLAPAVMLAMGGRPSRSPARRTQTGGLDDTAEIGASVWAAGGPLPTGNPAMAAAQQPQSRAVSNVAAEVWAVAGPASRTALAAMAQRPAGAADSNVGDAVWAAGGPLPARAGSKAQRPAEAALPTVTAADDVWAVGGPPGTAAARAVQSGVRTVEVDERVWAAAGSPPSGDAADAAVQHPTAVPASEVDADVWAAGGMPGAGPGRRRVLPPGRLSAADVAAGDVWAVGGPVPDRFRRRGVAADHFAAGRVGPQMALTGVPGGDEGPTEAPTGVWAAGGLPPMRAAPQSQGPRRVGDNPVVADLWAAGGPPAGRPGERRQLALAPGTIGADVWAAGGAPPAAPADGAVRSQHPAESARSGAAVRVWAAGGPPSRAVRRRSQSAERSAVEVRPRRAAA